MNSTKILEKLKSIELENNVEILFACESGSRAWGFSSPDSDFDIRFIYKRKMDDYLTLWETKDTIEFMTNDNLDGSGWDIKKALILLAKSNAPLYEWIFSPITYSSHAEFLRELQTVAIDSFSPIASIHHYLGTTKNFIDACQQDKVKLKNYFYALRTALAGKWIIDSKSIPPVAFSDLVKIAPPAIQFKIDELLKIKANQDESYTHPNDKLITDYILELIQYNTTHAAQLTSGKKMTDEIDNLFRKTILKSI